MRQQSCWGDRFSLDEIEKFFANPDLPALIAASGAAPQPPEITIAQAISSPDEY